MGDSAASASFPFLPPAPSARPGFSVPASRRHGFSRLRFAALIGALWIYGLFSSPTPDDPGLAEALIGILLLVAALPGLPGASGAPWRKAGLVFLFYGASLPLLIAAWNGNAPTAVLRDIVAFAFFLLPVFTADLFHGKTAEERRGWLVASVLFIGLCFAARVFLPLMESAADAAEWTRPPDPFYFANAPSVLFCALYLCGAGGLRLTEGTATHRMAGATMIALSALPVFAMAVITQRATMGYMALALTGLLMLALILRPARAAPLWLLTALALAAFSPSLGTLAGRLSLKTELVGANMRLEEARAVMDIVSGGGLSMLLGKGWGATFASPAVGGVIVNYTHNFLTALWLKTGLCGMAIGGFYIARFGLLLMPLSFRNPVAAAALAGPLLIDVFFYASYKSLDFGLILLMIPVFLAKGPKAGARFAPGGKTGQNDGKLPIHTRADAIPR